MLTLPGHPRETWSPPVAEAMKQLEIAKDDYQRKCEAIENQYLKPLDATFDGRAAADDQHDGEAHVTTRNQVAAVRDLF